MYKAPPTDLDWLAGTIGICARVSELADEMALGAIVLWAWGFESPLAHQAVLVESGAALSCSGSQPAAGGVPQHSTTSPICRNIT